MGDNTKQKDHVDSILQEFSTTSTLLVITRIYTTRGRVWKLFWLLVFVAMLAGCTYQMVSIFQKFFSREITTSVILSHGDIDFPSVTICSLNPIIYSHLMQHASDDLVHAFTNKSEEKFTQYTEYVDTLTYEERVAHGHQKESMFLWLHADVGEDYLDLQSVNLSTTLNPYFGNCFTFNSADTQDEPFPVKGTGFRNGIEMELHAQHDEYIPGYRLTQGFTMDIHPYNTIDRIESVGVSIPTGYCSYIGITQRVKQRLEPPYGQCDQEYADTFKQEYGYEYTVEACNATCYHYHKAETCGCVQTDCYMFYTPRQRASLPTCNVTANSQNDKCRKQVLEDVYKTETKKCSCPLPCREIDYDLDISLSSYSSDTMWEHYVDKICRREQARRANESTGYHISCEELRLTPEKDIHDFVKKNFAGVFIYFTDLSYDTYTEQISYERSQFLADFGGNLGLWLGASIFTVLEVVELFTKLGAVSIKQKQRAASHGIKDQLTERQRSLDNVELQNNKAL